MLFLYLMTVETAEKNTEKNFAELICESCGAAFSCGANAGECWCFAVETTPEKLTDWRGKYEKCLCRKCLDGTKRIDARR